MSRPLSDRNLTLLDLANRMDPDGKAGAIVEILNETNEILEDMVWKPGNLITGHQTKIRTGIPEPTWRKMYQGVQPTKSEVATITDTCGVMEAYSEIDCAEAELNGNTPAYRLSEDRPHLEGFNQSLASSLFYADETVTPAKFTGFAPRFNSLNAAVPTSRNIISGGGSGSDNMSIWLVVWGDETCFGIVPKNSKAGFQMEDKGKQTVPVFDSNNVYTGKMEAYITHYKMAAGLCVKDWRYVVRGANIDRSALTEDASGGAKLINLMISMTEKVPTLGMGRPVFYMSRVLRTYLRHQIQAKIANNLTMETVAGKRVVMYDGIPVRTCSALDVDEATVS